MLSFTDSAVLKFKEFIKEQKLTDRRDKDFLPYPEVEDDH